MGMEPFCIYIPDERLTLLDRRLVDYWVARSTAVTEIRGRRGR
jgi:hypothetical protein